MLTWRVFADPVTCSACMNITNKHMYVHTRIYTYIHTLYRFIMQVKNCECKNKVIRSIYKSWTLHWTLNFHLRTERKQATEFSYVYVIIYYVLAGQ